MHFFVYCQAKVTKKMKRRQCWRISTHFSQTWLSLFVMPPILIAMAGSSMAVQFQHSPLVLKHLTLGLEQLEWNCTIGIEIAEQLNENRKTVHISCGNVASRPFRCRLQLCFLCVTLKVNRIGWEALGCIQQLGVSIHRSNTCMTT